MVEQFRQPEKEFEARRVGNGLPTKYFCWLRRASKLPALRLNAGAIVGSLRSEAELRS